MEPIIVLNSFLMIYSNNRPDLVWSKFALARSRFGDTFNADILMKKDKHFNIALTATLKINYLIGKFRKQKSNYTAYVFESHALSFRILARGSMNSEQLLGQVWSVILFIDNKSQSVKLTFLSILCSCCRSSFHNKI